MHARNMSIVLVRLVALYLGYLTVQGFLQAVSYYMGPHIDFPPSWQYVVSNMATWNVFLPGFSAILVWILAERIVPKTGDDDVWNGTSSDFVVAGVSLLGIFFLVTTLYAFTQDEFRYIASWKFPSDYSEEVMERQYFRRNMGRASYAIQTLVAFGILAYRRRVAAFILLASERRGNAS